MLSALIGTTELGLQQMSASELLTFGILVILAILAAACFFTFLEIAWEKVFKRGPGSPLTS